MQRTESSIVQCTTYRLGSRDEILEVSLNWDAFALANAGGSCVADAVVGRELWAFVAGESTQMWLCTLFSLARTFRRTREIPYRCDSPTLRRQMSMCIQPQADGSLLLEHRILACAPHRAPRLTISPSSSPSALVRCSNCGRIQWDGRWVEWDLSTGLARRQRQPRGPLSVIYAVCGPCRRLCPPAR